MLNHKEQLYFNNLKKSIVSLFNLKVKIFSLDHRKFLNTKDAGNVIGCCHRIRDNKGNIIDYVITIDENYVRSCYYGRQALYSEYSDNKLIETICHEIAHLYFWKHDENHKNLTLELYNIAKTLNFS